MRKILVGFAAVAALAAPILAHGSRDYFSEKSSPGFAFVQGAQNPAPKSTALISGQVVDGVTGQPISEAVVTYTPAGSPRGGGGFAPEMAGASPEIQQALAAAAAAANAGRGQNLQQRVMTGSDGRFVFHDLPPGTSTLTVSLTGYTSSPSVNIGAGIAGILTSVMPSNSPTMVPLKEGEFATGVKLKLWKYAVVSGTVVDDAGDPAIGISVQVARRVMVAGRARYVPAQTAKTDDRGVYRIPSLTPGDYLVAVPQAQVSLPSSVLGGVMEGLKSGGIGSVAISMIDLMSSGVDFTNAIQGGVRMGDYMVASSGAVPLIGPDDRLLAYQTAFYPGASAPAQASVLSLKAGEDKDDVNFQLRLIPTSRVSGVALGPQGPVANLGIKLVVPADGLVSESEFDVSTAVTKNDGTFSFYGVPPGQFLLRAEKQPRPDIPAEALAMLGPIGPMPPGGKDMLFAVANVAVNGDIDNLVLQLVPGFRVSGKLEFVGVSGRQPPTGGQMATAQVVLMPVDGRMPSLMNLGFGGIL